MMQTIGAAFRKIAVSNDAKNIGLLSGISIGARGLQALVPILVVWRFGTSAETDFYFYWVAQSSLVATFLASVWPTVYVPYLVQLKILAGDAPVKAAAGCLLIRFLPIALAGGALLSLLSILGFWGFNAEPQQQYFLYLLSLTTVINCLAAVVGEIGSVSRKFGLFYFSQIFAVLGQIVALLLISSASALLNSFLLFSAIQLVGLVVMGSRLISFTDKKAAALSPGLGKLLQIYLGSLLTFLVGHCTYRFLASYGEGIISSYALALMLTAVPQQLLLSQMGTVAGISMAEDVQNVETIRRWRFLLSRASFVSALIVLLCCLVGFGLPYAGIDFLETRLPPHFLSMVALLSIPLASVGLNTWVSRLLMAQREVSIGVKVQVIFQLCTLTLLSVVYSMGASALQLLAVYPLVSLIYVMSVEKLISYLRPG